MGISRNRKKWRAEVYVNKKLVASKYGFQRKIDAQKWHDEQLAKYLNADSVVPGKKYTFDDLVKRYRETHLSTVARGTKRRYDVDLRLRIEPFFKYMAIEDLTPMVLEDFKLQITEELKDPKSVNNCIHVLRALLNKCVKWRMLKSSPYNLDSFRLPKKPYTWWDKKRYIREFLEDARNRTVYYPTYLLALQTGMRYGEVVGLGVKDVDFGRGKIHVHRQWLEKEQDYGPVKHKIPRWIDFDPKSVLGRQLKLSCQRTVNKDILFTTSNGNY